MNGEDVRYCDAQLAVRDGLKLHYRDYRGTRDGPPLLCLHGLTRNSRDYSEFALRYSPPWRVIALDFRGRGASDFDPQPMRYNPVTYARDVIALLDQLNVSEAVFVGTSLGGLVTMTIAAIAPQRIAASILNDVGPDLKKEGLERIRTYVGKNLRFASWDEAAETIARNNSHVPASFGHDDWLSMARRVCREDGGKIVFDYDMAIALPFEAQGPAPSIDMWPLFRTLGDKPLLVLRGEMSDLLDAKALDKMHEAVPKMKSVTVPGVGHAPMLNEPEAIAALDDFLESLVR